MSEVNEVNDKFKIEDEKLEQAAGGLFLDAFLDQSNSLRDLGDGVSGKKGRLGCEDSANSQIRGLGGGISGKKGHL